MLASPSPEAASAIETAIRDLPARVSEPSNPVPKTAPQAGAGTRRRWPRILAFALSVAGLAAVAFYFTVPEFYLVSTDDAYVDAHVVSMVPKVAAYVTALHVDDNSMVVANALLVELDPRDYDVAVSMAAADLQGAEASAANIDAQLVEQKAIIAQSEAAIAGDRSTLEFMRQQLVRYDSLAKTGYGTTQRWQQAQSDLGQSQAALQRDVAALDTARAHVGVLETQRRQAQAAISRQQAVLAQAQLNLSYTKIYATEAGTVANKKVEVGNFVQPGQVLFSTVPHDLYVTANYKETQLTEVRPGQKVTIRIDTFPQLRLRGHVDSLQRGTGAQFALLPPENATGNFVKVVQRVPVKVIFDSPDEALRWISPGMSAETSIEIAPPPWWLPLLSD
jgi:membrane fusion protein (multidrug efflux system)